jgi:predicted secreted hydrolase
MLFFLPNIFVYLLLNVGLTCTQSMSVPIRKMQVYFSEDWLPPGEYRKEGGFYSTGQLKTMDQTRIFRMFSITKRDQNGTDFIKYFAASVAMGARPVRP